MGDVYRVHDARLAREAALKILPDGATTDPERLRRFEHESRAVGALNHPNLLAVFDTGRHEDAPYIVFELLRGETLRARLEPGSLPTRKALQYATQIAQGLAAAHQAGIVHRDLKPENVFITADGRVKILDFGLAKLRANHEPERVHADAGTRSDITAAGTVLGTAAYMSPEQVEGKPADHRSDIFSLGSVLYEMLSGRRAFQRDSAIETMRAILKEDPPELTLTNTDVPAALERIVRRCLEKRAEERFQAVQDVAFALDALSALSGARAKELTAVAPAPRRTARVAVAATMLITCALAGLLAGRQIAQRRPTSFNRLTFRRGTNANARLAPDGHTIVYGAAWDDQPIRVFATRVDSTESRPLDLPEADLLAVSSTSELAILLHRPRGWPEHTLGMLARVPMGGGAPREVLDAVQGADWSPDGKELAVVHQVGKRRRLEFPIGNVLYEAEFLANPRVSPNGEFVAALAEIDGIVVADRHGHKKNWKAGKGLSRNFAWSPAGDEIWFTPGWGHRPSLEAIDLRGRTHRLSEFPSFARIEDVASDGRVLVSFGDLRAGMLGSAPGSTQERDLSWRSWSVVDGLSADGEMLFFSEIDEGTTTGLAEKTAQTYIRKTDGSAPAVRLGEGTGWDLSPDGKWALVARGRNSAYRDAMSELFLVPTGAGETRIVKGSGVQYSAGSFSPDGKRIVFMGYEPGHPPGLYLQDLERGPPRPLLFEGLPVPGWCVLSHDGRFAAMLNSEGRITLIPVAGGPGRFVPGPPESSFNPGEGASLVGWNTNEWDSLVGWSTDDRSVLLVRNRGLSMDVFLRDVTNGRRKLWKHITPADPAGIFGLAPVFSADAKHYAYTYRRFLSDLYLVDGLR